MLLEYLPEYLSISIWKFFVYISSTVILHVGQCVGKYTVKYVRGSLTLIAEENDFPRLILKHMDMKENGILLKNIP